jgi:hypothetical protein
LEDHAARYRKENPSSLSSLCSFLKRKVFVCREVKTTIRQKESNDYLIETALGNEFCRVFDVQWAILKGSSFDYL